jgi:hypothetical protein
VPHRRAVGQTRPSNTGGGSVLDDSAPQSYACKPGVARGPRGPKRAPPAGVTAFRAPPWTRYAASNRAPLSARALYARRDWPCATKFIPVLQLASLPSAACISANCFRNSLTARAREAAIPAPVGRGAGYCLFPLPQGTAVSKSNQGHPAQQRSKERLLCRHPIGICDRAEAIQTVEAEHSGG